LTNQVMKLKKGWHQLKTNKEELEKLYETMSQREIAEKLGCTQSAISYAMKRLGMKTKTARDYRSSKNPHWKGGRFINWAGYFLVRHNGKYVREHRLIMERMLGRPLKSTEEVHHLNGIRTDNRPENLVVIDTAKEKHETWTLVRAMQERIRELEEKLKEVKQDGKE